MSGIEVGYEQLSLAWRPTAQSMALDGVAKIDCQPWTVAACKELAMIGVRARGYALAQHQRRFWERSQFSMFGGHQGDDGRSEGGPLYHAPKGGCCRRQ
jgi:hypothetical protein